MNLSDHSFELYNVEKTVRKKNKNLYDSEIVQAAQLRDNEKDGPTESK
jgi:hypothetical protein